MKIRIKFKKTGNLKFIGHLDVVRYFQKAFRRAEVGIAYSKGYSPHQLLSFAAPLGIGLTSEGEYLDGEFEWVYSSKEMIEKLNSTMVDDLSILEWKLLPEDAENAMASVAAADYMVTLKEEYYQKEQILPYVATLCEKEEVLITKKTKKSEKEVDIRPMIYELRVENDVIFMKLATGSVANLKPETVISALCKEAEIEEKPYEVNIHRLETYLWNPNNQSELIPLGAIGREIEEEKLVDEVIE